MSSRTRYKSGIQTLTFQSAAKKHLICILISSHAIEGFNYRNFSSSLGPDPPTSDILSDFHKESWRTGVSDSKSTRLRIAAAKSIPQAGVAMLQSATPTVRAPTVEKLPVRISKHSSEQHGFYALFSTSGSSLWLVAAGSLPVTAV